LKEIMPSALSKAEAPPILDFSPFYNSDPSVRATLIQQIRRACQDKGFFQITNHGISGDLQEKIFGAAKDFFALPIEEKMKLDLKKNPYQRGYERIGGQMLEPGTAPDTKEGIYLGQDLPLDHPRVVAGEFKCGPNPWPEALDESFREVCMEYHDAVQDLAEKVMKCLAMALGLDESYFDEFMKNPTTTLRLLHYPPTPKASTKERGIGAHRDFGCITLLLQDDIGGLQVQDEDTGAWLDVKPTPGAYVVNLGNLTMRWTNHHFRSNTHRVLNFSEKERYSVPFFYNGNSRHVLECLPGCEEAENRATEKFEPIGVEAFIRAQFVESYERASQHKEEAAT